MILDELNEFCDAAALNTGVPGSYLVGDVIDLQETLKDIGNGEVPYLVITMDTAATSAGAATASFALCSDAQAAIAVDGSQTTHFSTGPVALANLAAGKMVAAVKLPMGIYERYLGIVQTTGTAAFTGGKVNAFLTRDVAKWAAYPNAANA